MPSWFLSLGRLARSGPPDLDEVFRNLRRNVGRLFGETPSQNQNEPPRKSWSPAPINASMVAGVLLVVLALWLASGFYKVDVAEKAVVLRFGKHVRTTDPGLNWRLPYPFETVEKVNVAQVRTVEIGYHGEQKNQNIDEAEMITSEENIVDVQFAVQYVIKSAEDYLFLSQRPDESVRQAAESAIREWVGKSSIDFVLYEGRSDIAANTQKLLQEIIDRYGTGILIRSVTMQNIQPPQQVQDAFDDAVRAVQDRDRQRNEGEAYANNVIPRAQGAAARLVAEANGYKQKVIAGAEGESSRFSQILSSYASAPVVTRQRMYLETLERIYARNQKILIDAKAQGNLFVLPLDKILSLSGAATGSNADGSDNNNVAGGSGNSTGLESSPIAEPKVDPLPKMGGTTDKESLLGRDRDARSARPLP